MCGLLGLYTSRKTGLYKMDIDEFKMMMYLTSFRGRDSTGVAGIDLGSENEASLIKAHGAPHYLFNYKETDTFFQRAITNHTALIGHTRYATRGEVHAMNAHPFKEGHITLAHNGVINNFDALKDKKLHTDIDVDSHLIARLFQEQGALETIEQVEGAFVFMWFDEKERTFNIARNFQRPLFVGNNNDFNLLFASEKETLQWNESRNKTPLKEIYELEPYKIHSWMEGSIVPIVEPFKPYVKVYPTYTRPQRPAWDYDGVNYADDEWEDRPLLPVPVSNVVQLPANGHTKASNMNATIADLMTHSKLKKDSDIKINDVVTFSIFDSEVGSLNTMIEGYADAYPNILFKATFNHRIPDELLRTREFLKGTVRQISKAAAGVKHDFVVYCVPIALLENENDAVVKTEEPKKSKHITFKNFDQVDVSIPRTQVKELLKEMCPWCLESHPTYTEEELTKCMVLEDASCLVCIDCAETMFEYWAKAAAQKVGEGAVH